MKRCPVCHREYPDKSLFCNQDGSKLLAEAQNQVRLIIRSPDGNVREAIVADGVSFIGKSPDNTIVVTDGAISRRHSQLEFRQGQCFIKDLGSTNGTYVNGVKIGDQEVALKEGDEVKLGGTKIQLQLMPDISQPETMESPGADVPAFSKTTAIDAIPALEKPPAKAPADLPAPPPAPDQSAMSTGSLRKKARYPGSKPFTQNDEGLFFGRDEDIAKLTTFINVEKTIVLYGKSGLGKSSLLNAGVLPKLEKEHQYFIIPLRFGSYTEANLKQPFYIVEEQLAELSSQQSFLNEIEPEDISLWQHIKNLELANKDSSTFLLVFDQFEELFTYPEGVNDFAEALAEALYNRMPKSFQRALRLATRNNSDLLTPEQWEFLERPINLKVLTAIRSDRMSLLDGLSSHIPSILQNCYELKPLSRAQAELAITKPSQKAGGFRSPPFNYQPEALKKILDYLTQDGTKPIESFQLQILCQHVEETIVIARNDTYVEEEDLGDLEKIYQHYYDRSLKKVGTEEEQLRAREFIEEGLIFEKEERRISLYEGQIQSQYQIGPDLLGNLVDTHIIRAEPHGSGGYMYEVSHDTLVAPILRAKARRYQEEQERKMQQHLQEEKTKRRRKIRRLFVIVFGPPILLLSIFLLAIVLAFLEGVFGFSFPQSVYGVLGVVAGLYFVVVFLVISLIAPVAFTHEFITGESILSKLRKRAEDPAKQKGILTKLGKWLS